MPRARRSDHKFVNQSIVYKLKKSLLRDCIGEKSHRHPMQFNFYTAAKGKSNWRKGERFMGLLRPLE